jgi:hypothetical protein
MLRSPHSFAAGIGDHFMPKLRCRRVGWLGLAILSMGGPLNAADSPRITIPAPRIQLSRPPLPPPNVDAGRGAMPAKGPPTPGSSAKASGSQQQKRASRSPAPAGGGGLESSTIAGGGGLSSLPSDGGGGLDTQALLGAGPAKGTPR